MKVDPKIRHHVMITAAVGMATAAHYVFYYLAPEYINWSPLAGFGASLLWIWKD